MQIINQRNISWQVGRRVESARATTGVEVGNESMFEDPICAGEGGGEARGDAVASCFDLWEVEVYFGYDAGHIDALVVWSR